MKRIYTKTNWIDNKTPVNAANLNNIERGIADLYTNAVSRSEIIEGNGINIETTSSGGLQISTENVVRSGSCKGIEIIYQESDNPMDYVESTLYYLLDPSSKKLKKIILNGITIYEVGGES